MRRPLEEQLRLGLIMWALGLAMQSRCILLSVTNPIVTENGS